MSRHKPQSRKQQSNAHAVQPSKHSADSSEPSSTDEHNPLCGVYRTVAGSPDLPTMEQNQVDHSRQSDKEDSKSSLLLSLTPEERKLLVRSLELVEREVFEKVVARLRQYSLVIIGVLTGFGYLTMNNLRTVFIDTVTTKLASDAELRSAVEKNASKRIEEAADLVHRSEELAADLERESARINANLSVELKKIVTMLEQLNEEVLLVKGQSAAINVPELQSSNADKKHDSK